MCEFRVAEDVMCVFCVYVFKEEHDCIFSGIGLVDCDMLLRVEELVLWVAEEFALFADRALVVISCRVFCA